MNRLEQDAADELAGHEQQRVWRERAKANWDHYNRKTPTKTWAPVHAEQQKEAFQRYSVKHNLPF